MNTLRGFHYRNAALAHNRQTRLLHRTAPSAAPPFQPPLPKTHLFLPISVLFNRARLQYEWRETPIFTPADTGAKGNLEAAPLQQHDARTARSHRDTVGIALGRVYRQSSSLEHPVE